MSADYSSRICQTCKAETDAELECAQIALDRVIDKRNAASPPTEEDFQNVAKRMQDAREKHNQVQKSHCYCFENATLR